MTRRLSELKVNYELYQDCFNQASSSQCTLLLLLENRRLLSISLEPPFLNNEKGFKFNLNIEHRLYMDCVLFDLRGKTIYKP